MVHLARGVEAAPERGEQLASSGANNSLRAGRATRFGRGEQLASSEANNSLRARRTTRSERGEQLAPSEASNSLRAGQATRFGRGEQLASSGASNTLRSGRATRSERGGRNIAESTALFNCRFLKLYIFQLFPAPIECKVLEYIICAQANLHKNFGKKHSLRRPIRDSKGQGGRDNLVL